MVCLLYGLSCAGLPVQMYEMPCHTRGICAVCLLYGLLCARLTVQTVEMPCHTCDIWTVSLQYELYCDLLMLQCFDNTFHIQYICIYQCVYTCDWLSDVLFYTVCHTLYTNTALTCHHVDAQWYHYYQLQSSLQSISLYNIVNISFNK